MTIHWTAGSILRYDVTINVKMTGDFDWVRFDLYQNATSGTNLLKTSNRREKLIGMNYIGTYSGSSSAIWVSFFYLVVTGFWGATLGAIPSTTINNQPNPLAKR